QRGGVRSGGARLDECDGSFRLRHRFGFRQLQRGAAAEEAARWLGIAPEEVEKYLRLLEEPQEFRPGCRGRQRRPALPGDRSAVSHRVIMTGQLVSPPAISSAAAVIDKAKNRGSNSPRAAARQGANPGGCTDVRREVGRRVDAEQVKLALPSSSFERSVHWSLWVSHQASGSPAPGSARSIRLQVSAGHRHASVSGVRHQRDGRFLP
ncbi:MAG: Tyrosine recombinase XerC, partial [Variovorax sp.]|nr:Tyrosine recombinase XerC [Variovorax sp.]